MLNNMKRKFSIPWHNVRSIRLSQWAVVHLQWIITNQVWLQCVSIPQDFKPNEIFQHEDALLVSVHSHEYLELIPGTWEIPRVYLCKKNLARELCGKMQPWAFCVQVLQCVGVCICIIYACVTSGGQSTQSHCLTKKYSCWNITLVEVKVSQ